MQSINIPLARRSKVAKSRKLEICIQLTWLFKIIYGYIFSGLEES